MSGPAHRIARWLRLGLTSLSLVLGAMPAHALPAAQAVVTVSVERRESERVRPATEAATPSHVPATRHVQAHAPSACVGIVREARPPGPPRRLFIAHRALLR